MSDAGLEPEVFHLRPQVLPRPVSLSGCAVKLTPGSLHLCAFALLGAFANSNFNSKVSCEK